MRFGYVRKAFLVAGALTSVFWWGVTSAQIIDASECLQMTDLEGQAVCLAERAKEAEAPEVCMLSEHEATRWRCWASYAENNGDAALCRALPENEPYRDLREHCLSDVAVERMAPRLCAEIETEVSRDSCYFRVADDVCQRIDDPGLRRQCP